MKLIPIIICILAVCLTCCNSKISQEVQIQEEAVLTETDRFPPIPKELIGKEIDTIISYDPETFDEKIEYILSSELPKNDSLRIPGDYIARGIDTIVIFDPETIEEFVIIINHDTGQRDTMKVIDLD